MIDGSNTGGLDSQQDKKISFQQFIETRASENIFDNDVSLLNSLTLFYSYLKHNTNFGKTQKIGKPVSKKSGSSSNVRMLLVESMPRLCKKALK